MHISRELNTSESKFDWLIILSTERNRGRHRGQGLDNFVSVAGDQKQRRLTDNHSANIMMHRHYSRQETLSIIRLVFFFLFRLIIYFFPDEHVSFSKFLF